MYSLNLQMDARPILRLYKELPDALKRRVLRQAMESGAQPMVQALRREVRAHKTPDSTGVLGNSIGVVVRTNPINLLTNVRVGAIRKPAVQVPLKRQRAATRTRQGKRHWVIRRGTRYFHLADKGRQGHERVRRLFAGLKTQVAALVAQKFEAGLIREHNKLVNLG